jgi:hypothetical protein
MRLYVGMYRQAGWLHHRFGEQASKAFCHKESVDFHKVPPYPPKPKLYKICAPSAHCGWSSLGKLQLAFARLAVG